VRTSKLVESEAAGPPGRICESRRGRDRPWGSRNTASRCVPGNSADSSLTSASGMPGRRKIRGSRRILAEHPNITGVTSSKGDANRLGLQVGVLSRSRQHVTGLELTSCLSSARPRGGTGPKSLPPPSWPGNVGKNGAGPSKGSGRSRGQRDQDPTCVAGAALTVVLAIVAGHRRLPSWLAGLPSNNYRPFDSCNRSRNAVSVHDPAAAVAPASVCLVGL
jgi:hypothetical protein